MVINEGKKQVVSSVIDFTFHNDVDTYKVKS